MKIWLYYWFMITTIVQLTFCCEEYPYEETYHVWIPFKTTTESNYHDEEEVNESDLYDYVEQTKITNSTIICENLTSLNQILFNYLEKNYEQHLKIVNSNISTLKASALINFSTITKLYLSNLHIKTILPGAFNGLTELRELYLDHNELTELSKGVYNSLHKLKILNLASNRIHQIEKLALSGVGNLLNLNLVKNNLSIIDEGLFEVHLKILNLSENPLETVYLEDLKNLEELYLANTSLTKFDTNLSTLSISVLNFSSSQLSLVDFSSFPNVRNLDLSNNNIFVLKNCNQLRANIVNLAHNQINNFNGSFQIFSELNMAHNNLIILNKLYFQNSPTIKKLDFSYNAISSIEVDTFYNLFYLTTLFLQHNEILKIEPSLFKHLNSLKNLNLSYNRIEKFDFGTFDYLENLLLLDISHNSLTNLDPNAFHSLSLLNFLYIDNNQISSFNVHNLPQLHFLSLNGNPWTCKELFKIFHYAKQRLSLNVAHGNYHHGSNVYGIACEESENDDPITNSQQKFNWNIKNSTMERFFNEDFEKSNFFRFFNEGYTHSNFFKYLENYKPFKINDKVSLGSESYTEKITSLQVTPNGSNERILVFVVVILILIAFMLFSGVTFIFCILMKLKQIYSKSKVSSQIELC